MRANAPGGRFTSDFERNSILEGVNSDLRNSVGTKAEWWFFDLATTNIDPIYDVGDGFSTIGGGRKWDGPYPMPVVRSVITVGSANASELGFYVPDKLHITLNIEDLKNIYPTLESQIQLLGQQDKDRIVWQSKIYRPTTTQQRGIISELYTLLAIDLIEVMPEEMVNDPQFLQYAS
jgi:hypothetical protein